MSVEVVSISRTLGSGGEPIGTALAARLGFRYVDEGIISVASEKARVAPPVIADAEHRRSLVARMMDSLAVVPLAKSLLAAEFESNRAALPGSREAYRALIREAIADIAASGHVVIVAHAASLMLAGSPGVLRVLVTASPATRAERLGLWDKSLDARRTEEVIAESDNERRIYLRDFYGVSEELPIHYDLVVNTDVVTTDQAVAAVLAVIQNWQG